MFFNSIQFAIFLPVVFALYWAVGKHNRKVQNVILLLASYFFYAFWDYRFLFLLIFSTLLDYFTGIKMAESSTATRKRMWFWLSIVVNLGFLGVFKYYNFFAESFANLLESFGLKANMYTLRIILPVGISFYTFHGLSYVIDIYKDRIKPELDFIDYSLFVSFFPLLVAGPIERATHLLPQLKQEREFSYLKAVDGLRQILWGLFKKIVIADNCAEVANRVFDDPAGQPASMLVMGAVFFAIQIYGDFSGYSDIALGTARLFGVELLRNFAFPYFSRDIAEFWRRWHISLSTWFRDYLYIPMGGSKVGFGKQVRNTFIIFLLSGFWHGANWTFIFWGLLHALYFLPLLLLNRNRTNLETVAQGRYLPTIKEAGQMAITFILVVFAWIFFRAENMSDAIAYISGMFSLTIFQSPQGISLRLFICIGLFILLEWLGRERQYAISHIGLSWPRGIRWSFYYAIILCILYFSGEEQQFIYFQF